MGYWINHAANWTFVAMLLCRYNIIPAKQHIAFLRKSTKIIGLNPNWCPIRGEDDAIYAFKHCADWVLSSLDKLKEDKRISSAEWGKARSIVLNGVKTWDAILAG